MKNEILERMNEKRNHLHSFAHFYGLFLKFPGSFTFSGIFTSERAKTYSSKVRTYLKMASGRALFSSGIFQLYSNYYLDLIPRRQKH